MLVTQLFFPCSSKCSNVKQAFYGITFFIHSSNRKPITNCTNIIMHLYAMGTLQYRHISYCLVSFDPPHETFLMQTFFSFYLMTLIILKAPDLCGVQKHWLHFRVEKLPKTFHRLIIKLVQNTQNTHDLPFTSCSQVTASSAEP